MMQYFAEPAIQSWIELDTLLRDYELGLVAIAGVDDNTGARAVQWVHSSDLPDPTPFLTPRTVLLTTGVQFKSALGKNTAEAYVSRLVRAGAAALGVGVGLRWDRIPPTLVEACEHLGLPLIRVPYDTPFIAITRAAARLIEAAMHAQNIDRLTRSDRTPATRITSAEAALRSAIVSLLIRGDREHAEAIAAPLYPRLPRGQVAVIALRAGDGDLSPQDLGEGITSGVHDGKLIVICESAHVTQLRKLIAKRTAGLSERGSLNDLSRLLDQADRALEQSIAAWVETDAPPKLVAYRPSMHSGVFQLIAESPEAKRRATGFLSPLREHDRRHHDEIEHSLEVWLRHNCQLTPAAEELQIHRHTMRTRIKTAASLLQRNIDSADTRAELWTALRLAGATIPLSTAQ
ncbi:PucR family transcriptional regulator [Leucobacter denitrificans]|uniref:PucR family transcriptional regulator n=1 Tax=Leucobacter denitrificans TaxID=683042 RepID=A0A7G9S5B2_9MICO|nr:PucR family transcriptional regulator [Leucobacter denitrificans]QNN63037.1 PucR family transcriptional regulator [Leucobacter denitrificans]